MNDSILVRFDCDLILDADGPPCKRNSLRFNEATHFQRGVTLPESWRQTIEHDRAAIDHDKVMGVAARKLDGRIRRRAS